MLNACCKAPVESTMSVNRYLLVAERINNKGELSLGIMVGESEAREVIPWSDTLTRSQRMMDNRRDGLQRVGEKLPLPITVLISLGIMRYGGLLEGFWNGGLKPSASIPSRALAITGREH